jgi:O6-methylguanine-DNA--protein-cysteine methyltransferase
MSDEDRREEDKEGQAEEGESDHEYLQRLASPELRWLDLFEKLTARVERTEERVKTNEEETKRRAEEMQRNMDFIIRQQAQFASGMQQLRESQERAELRWERTEESVRSLHAIAQIHEGEITTLAEAQARTNAQMAETDERLNALINTVERIISERRNGGGRGEEKSE